MLRILRIVGILFFALMIGVSANNIRLMQESGELFEKYNSARRANITIFGASIIVVGILGAFELSRAKRAAESRGLRYGQPQRDDAVEDEPPVTTDIYSTPETKDAWGRKRGGRGLRAGYKEGVDLGVVWMSLLRVFCFALPVFYVVLLVTRILQGYTPDMEFWLPAGAFGFMALLSFLAATGLCMIKTWGYTLGYIVAIINLIVFPYGTALGLIVLVILVGTAPLFSVSDRDRRRAMRKKAAKRQKAHSSAS